MGKGTRNRIRWRNQELKTAGSQTWGTREKMTNAKVNSSESFLSLVLFCHSNRAYFLFSSIKQFIEHEFHVATASYFVN